MSYNQLRIAKIIQETPDARSFVLEIPPALAEKYRYRAGQFLTVRVPHADGAFNLLRMRRAHATYEREASRDGEGGNLGGQNDVFHRRPLPEVSKYCLRYSSRVKNAWNPLIQPLFSPQESP